MNAETSHAKVVTRRVGVCTFIGGLGGGLVFPILPALGLQLGISSLVIGLILAANRITRLVFDVPAGRFVDRVGGKRALTIGLCLEAVGIMAYGGGLPLGHIAWWFLGGRILFGIGSAFLMVGAQALVLQWSSHADRGRRTATVRIALSLGMPGGLVLGGVIADLASDETAFFVGAVATLMAAGLAWWRVPSAPAQPRRRGPAQGQGAIQPRPVAAPAKAHVLMAAWTFNALIFFSVQGVLLATLVVLARNRALHLLGFGDQGSAGLIMAALMVCATVAAFAIGQSIDHLRFRSIVVLPSLAILAAGFAVLAYAASWPIELIGAVLVGSGFNGVTLPMLALLGDVTRPEEYGRAVGIYQRFGDIGGSIGPILGLTIGMQFGLRSLYLGVAALIAFACTAIMAIYRNERRLPRTLEADVPVWPNEHSTTKG